MALVTHRRTAWEELRGHRGLLGLAACLLVGGCAQLPGGPSPLTLGDSPHAKKPAAAENEPPASDLQKATEYWGKQYAQSPRDLRNALNFGRNLKAMGEKERALAVYQQAAIFHGESRDLASEYGRLALDLNQVQLASRLLAIADDPARPDWRVISARGTVLAKQGKYAEAIPFYDRALALAHDQPSLLSNLALATAMSGNPARAEQLLRQAEAADGNSPKIRQNLALVLGLQGKYDEAKLMGARDLSMETASENTTYLRQVVKLNPKAVPNSVDKTMDVAEAPAETTAKVKSTQTKVAQAPQAKARLANTKPSAPANAPETPAVPAAPVAEAVPADVAWATEAQEERGAIPAPQPWTTGLKTAAATPAPAPVSVAASDVTHKDIDLSLRAPEKKAVPADKNADTDAVLPPGKVAEAAVLWSANVSAHAAKTKIDAKAPPAGVVHKDIDLSLRAPEPTKKKDQDAVLAPTGLAPDSTGQSARK